VVPSGTELSRPSGICFVSLCPIGLGKVVESSWSFLPFRIHHFRVSLKIEVMISTGTKWWMV